MNTEHMHQHIYLTLTRSMEINPEELKHYSARECFQRYCEWNGIIGYSDQLFDAVQNLIACEGKTS